MVLITDDSKVVGKASSEVECNRTQCDLNAEWT